MIPILFIIAAVGMWFVLPGVLKLLVLPGAFAARVAYTLYAFHIFAPGVPITPLDACRLTYDDIGRWIARTLR